MKHICEICNKQYGTVEGAEQCELAHKKEMTEERAKTAAEAKISAAVNAYITRYREFPDIEISAENQKILFDDMSDGLEKTFDMLINILFDEKCDCDCKKS